MQADAKAIDRNKKIQRLQAWHLTGPHNNEGHVRVLSAASRVIPYCTSMPLDVKHTVYGDANKEHQDGRSYSTKQPTRQQRGSWDSRSAHQPGT